MIIARKDGKWMVKVGKHMYPEDYSRCTYGLDPKASVFQIEQGMVFWRPAGKQTRCLDLPKLIYGKHHQVWEPTGNTITYRFKDRVFVLQAANQYDYRPRRKPAYKRTPESWWVIHSVDDVPVTNTLLMLQRGTTPVDAMSGYLRYIRTFQFPKVTVELVARTPIHVLF